MKGSCEFTRQMSKQTRVSIILPVKDEAGTLLKTLEALRSQFDGENANLDYNIYEVLVLINNTSDQSEALIKRFQIAHPEFQLYYCVVWLEAKDAHIGMVRRMLMDAAHRRFMESGITNGIIVSTDGDSFVHPTWVHNIIFEMDKGNDVVGGRIIAHSNTSTSRIFHLQDVTYRMLVNQVEAQIDPIEHDPWPRHFQCFGPSLAVKTQIYEKAGRLPIIPALEDEEFRKSLYRIDARVRRSPNVKVYTSSRTSGKVPFGFSVQLKQWADMYQKGDDIIVESLMALLIRFKLKKYIRLLWECKVQPEIEKEKILVDLCQIDESWLRNAVSSAKYFGQLWEEIELRFLTGNWLYYFPMVPIKTAIRDLRNYLTPKANVSIRQAGNPLSSSVNVIANEPYLQ
ncbi:MAG: glycosyltransferase [Mucilaginibacter polytrichastri]|nr:glycosyltransferase [Mucilaginibacter polytrichastri]